MYFNTRGGDVLAKVVTATTFRGPPIIACSYNEFTASAVLYWSNLETLAALLNVPAILIDIVNDGTPGLQTLLAGLDALRPFYSPGSLEPWYHAFAPQLPPCGPLFFFDYVANPDGTPDFNAPSGASLAADIALSTVRAPRGSHVYGHAMSGVWPVLGSNLDRLQYPPIHTFQDPGFSQASWWTTTLLSYWRSGMPALNLGDATFAQTYSQGLQNLALVEPTYPGITRHFLPTLIAPSRTNRLLILQPT